MLPIKRQHHNLFLTTALATILFGLTATRLSAETITVNGNFTGPMTTQGQSGGGVNSNDCGFVPSTPQETIKVTEKINYLRLSVESGSGNPTVLIDGPDGRFCLLADSVNKPSLSGIWMPGEYKVYVGDEQGQQHQYTLRLSTQR
ncbi:hypothetical protein PCC7418_0155 [Halothece sp. PCC 7418]|uniref:hypothetical protein n=1 Tax=Halothece sp. (strain PCC 7418) TaxID=65093 RepID=UPI0002A066B3|nr:hypothetical protein [Halothece sp. PCC 7418]AFZ42397.1 hypothetical protein PCC7418_0155 [Halothece sp. PCC 7418]